MIYRRTMTSILIMGLLFISSGSWATERYVPNELVVKFKESASGQAQVFAAGKSQQAPGVTLSSIHQQYGLKKMQRAFKDLDAVSVDITDRQAYVAHVRTMKGAKKSGRKQDKFATLPNLHNIYHLEFSQSNIDVKDLAEKYQNDPAVEYAHPNYLFELAITPNDTNYAQQWAHTNMSSEAGWDIETGESSVVIAIVDTGVDWDHPDLAANIWTNPGEIDGNGIDDDSNGFIDDIRGWDWVDHTNADGFAVGEDIGPADNDPMDFYGHGTVVAGVAAAVGNNSTGLAGVAWGCQIMPLRVGAAELSSGNAYITATWMAQAINYAAANGADVINISLIDNNWPGAVGDAVDTAYGLGCVIVGAAGNYGTDGRMYPAASPKVIGVAATDQTDQRSIWGIPQPPFYQGVSSNYGSWVQVSAPGTSITSTAFNDSYESNNGTSLSAPQVSGLAGLILSNNPALTNDEVMEIIYSTTDPVVSDKYIGSGRINIQQALQMTAVPEAKINTPYAEQTLASNINVEGTAGGANFSSYTLQYGLRLYPGSWSTIASGSSAVSNGALGTWNVDALQDNMFYTLRLSVTDTLGNTSIDEMVVFIQRSVTSGWPQSITTVFNRDGVAVGDADNDGDSEILVVATRVISGPQQTNDIYLYHHDGTPVMGWPRTDVNRYCRSATLADVTGNDEMEIILSGYDWGYPNSTTSFHVFDRSGNYLPGWPQTHVAEYGLSGTTPAVGDVNNDGIQEIVFSLSPTSSAATTTTAIFVYGNNGVALPGWPKYIPQPSNYHGSTKPCLVDFDNDGDLEIVVGVTYPTNSRLYVFHHDGTVMAGWPQDYVDTYAPEQVIGDIDNDGDYEIMGATGNGRLYAWNHDGTAYPGWPFVLPVSGGCSDPILTDMDGDHDLELIVHTAGDQVFAYHHDATPVTGWPVNVSPIAGNSEWPNALTGDIDGDGLPEVIQASGDETYIYAWNHDGTTVSGWPRLLPQGVHISPALWDMDNNGDVDLVIAYEDTLTIWDLGVPFSRDAFPWAMSWFNNRHTGAYVTDFVDPSVSIQTPSSGANVTGPLPISATASDDVGVVGVQFLIDNTPIGSEDMTAPYALVWDSSLASNGAHTLEAVVRDGAGNQGVSAPVSITINNPTPTPTPMASRTVTPTVTMTQTISPTATITPTVTATPSITVTATITPTLNLQIEVDDVRIIGSLTGRGTVNPDRGESAKIYFQAKSAGKVECSIFTLTGKRVWQDVREGVLEGVFEWKPGQAAPGVYLVYVKGEGFKVRKKMVILK